MSSHSIFFIAYTSGYELKLHVMKHFNLKPFHCDYPGCKWRFVTQAKLQRHRKSHEKAKPYPCSFNNCDKMFSSSYNLSVHMKSHSRLLDHPCTLCNQKFSSKNSLNEHISRYARYFIITLNYTFLIQN